MENVYENVKRELSHEHVKEALQVMLERVHLPDNQVKIEAAKHDAGDDMVLLMKHVFPIVVEIQICVLGMFGFVQNLDGLKEFLIRVNQFTTEDEEIHDLLMKIKQTYLPPYNEK